MRFEDKKTVVHFCREHKYVAALEHLNNQFGYYMDKSADMKTDYYINIADVLNMLGEYDKVDETLNLAMTSSRASKKAAAWSVDIHLAQSGSLIQRGSLKAAKTLLTNLPNNDMTPLQYVDSQKQMGRLLKITNHYKESLDCYYRANAQSVLPNNDAIKNEIEFLRKTIERDDDNDGAGLTSYATYLSVIKSHDRKPYHPNLGIFFLETQLKEEGKSHRKSYLHSLLSRFHFNINNIEKAKEHVSHAIDLNPNNKYAISNGICILLTSDRAEDAKEIWEHSKDILEPDPYISIRLAYAFKKANMLSIAYNLTESALTYGGDIDEIRETATGLAHGLAKSPQNKEKQTVKEEPLDVADTAPQQAPQKFVCALLTPIRN